MNITDWIAKDCSGWDGDIESIQLYDATLVIDTPKFKAGTKVEVISFDFIKSKCEIFGPRNGEPGSQQEILDSFSIKLVIA